MKEIVIDTGTPRNVLGHVISGAIASAVVSGAINYKKAQNRQITKKEAIKHGQYLRTGGLAYRGELKKSENPMAVVYDSKKNEQIYCQPLYTYALKK